MGYGINGGVSIDFSKRRLRENTRPVSLGERSRVPRVCRRTTKYGNESTTKEKNFKRRVRKDGPLVCNVSRGLSRGLVEEVICA